MKKQIPILIFCFLVFNFVNAISYHKNVEVFDGYQEATIHFLDGTSIKGYGKLVGLAVISNEKYKVKFKASKDSKPEVWADLMIKGITFHYEFDDITFLYVKLSEKSYPRLLQLVEEGPVSLYTEIQNYWETSSFDSKTGFPINDYKQEIFYYLKRKQDGEVLILTNTNSLSGSVKSIFLNFKKKVKKYFHDCDGIKNNLDSGDFNRTNIPGMVYYYNDFCADY